MLTIAATRGGELLKFGGDALLFLFRGDDHPEQACDAAVEMRASLRAAAAVPTSAGRFSLSMSVGVHAGDIELFLVGSPTRELLVLGPGASAVALAEKAADAGQVVVSPATAARLPRGSARPRDDGALLLRRRLPHTAASRPASAPSDTGQRMATLFPTALGEYLAPGPPDPEHRVATIAFVRFSGTDTVLAQEGPQALAERLHALVSTVEEALEAEGVTLLATDLDTDGGKFFLGAGVPSTREDDEGRMLRALRRIADADLPLPLQLGVNRGHVFAAEVGVDGRAAYSAMGDTTNTAARIMSTAAPGAIHAHPDVLEHSRTRFAVTPAGPFAMKGKAQPLAVYAVGEETGTREGVDDARLPFLGRDAESATVRRALADALGGAGGVITVDGATGMGKSRLVHEALDTATGTTGARRIVFRAEPYGASSTYRMLRDPLRTLLGVTRAEPQVMGRALLATLERSAPDLVPMASLLADVVQVEVASSPESDRIDPQFRADRTADLVVDLLGRLVPGPLVVVVEEAHWADGASVALLNRLAFATEGRPWAVVVVRRGETGGFAPASGVRVDLQPLPPDVIEHLVHAATEATPLRPHEVAAIVERAEGNPLFVEEVTRLAVGSGSLDQLPESVHAAMSTQIDQLHPRVRRILRYCAVLGRSFRREVLQRILASDDITLDAAMLSALSSFIEPDDESRVRFRNSLVRDAAYEGLAFRVRAHIHGLAGEVLEAVSTDRDADSPTLALHFERAGDAARTWRYSQMAGNLAERSYANADAARHLQNAIEVSRRLPDVTDADRARLWTRIGGLAELAGMFAESVDAYRRAERLLGEDPLAQANVLALRATVHTRTGELTAATRAVGRARRLLADIGEDGRATLVQLDGLTARIRVEQERLGDAMVWAERAAAGARATDDAERLVLALVFLDTVEIYMGVPGLGARHLEALQICIDENLRPLEEVVRGNLGTLSYFAGRWTEAAEWYRTAREVAMEVGKDFGAAETGVNLGELLINQGHVDDAELLLTDALRVLRASGAALFIAQGEVQLARVRLMRGDNAAAEELGAATAARLLELDKATSALEASLVQADAMIREGRAQQALYTIDAAEHAASTEAASALPRICLQRSRALLALGRFAEAEELVNTGVLAARETQVPYDEALLLRVRSRVLRHEGDDAGALRDWADAERILESLGAATITSAATDGPGAATS
jgi:class 3 adenylate cyclase/tetratricopeptide (TPR) repeat protein